jgi:hypothetical protein
MTFNEDTKRMLLGNTQADDHGNIHEVWIMYTQTSNGVRAHTYKSGDRHGQDEKISILTDRGYTLDVDTIPAEIIGQLGHAIWRPWYRKTSVIPYLNHFKKIEAYKEIRVQQQQTRTSTPVTPRRPKRKAAKEERGPESNDDDDEIQEDMETNGRRPKKPRTKKDSGNNETVKVEEAQEKVDTPPETQDGNGNSVNSGRKPLVRADGPESSRSVGSDPVPSIIPRSQSEDRWQEFFDCVNSVRAFSKKMRAESNTR